MRSSCLIIDGVGLYIFFIIFICMLFAIILLGSAYTKESRENRILRRQNKRLKINYSNLKEIYYKETFNVPDMEKENV